MHAHTINISLYEREFPKLCHIFCLQSARDQNNNNNNHKTRGSFFPLAFIISQFLLHTVALFYSYLKNIVFADI